MITVTTAEQYTAAKVHLEAIGFSNVPAVEDVDFDAGALIISASLSFKHKVVSDYSVSLVGPQ